MNDIIREFVLETNESLAQLDLDLLTLERDPEERETLARVFRTLHTVKGNAGFLGLNKLQSLGHAGENLLGKLRARELKLNSEIASALLGVVDAIRTILAAIESTEHEPERDYSDLIRTLEKLTLSGSGVRPTPQTPVVQPPATKMPEPPAPPPAEQLPLPVSADTRDPSGPSDTRRQELPESQAPTLIAKSPLLDRNPSGSSDTRRQDLPESQAPTLIAKSPLLDRNPSGSSDTRRQDLPESQAPTLIAKSPLLDRGGLKIPVGRVVASNKDPRPQENTAESPVADSTEPRGPAVTDTSVRVDISLLDKLMNLVGELVLARNQVMQFSSTQQDPVFLATVQQFNLLTTELQTGVMKTRMQPIGNLWSKFPRVVRDLALACEKQVRIVLEGQETELDRTIVEAIRDPLTHMVRNAVDHGIEPPAERLNRGKPAEGRLLLHASHKGGKVVIEISDDGSGIDLIRVRNKGVQAGLVSPEHAARMSERELINLVFLPGFSTTDRVTHFSGRGVGMDVVRTNIEKIGGTVEIESRAGKGTTVRMQIPLTLAIIPALTITTGGDRYAIPQVSLLELVRLEGKQKQKGIEFIHGVPVYRLRGNLLPLVHLDHELQVESSLEASGVVNIVVLQAEDRPFGLIVDEIHDTEEIVVKPLQKQLKGIPVFSGATIMGDGRVALILDVAGLAERSGVVTDVRDRSLASKAVTNEPVVDMQTVLLFTTSGGGRMAIPLTQVARLEEFPREKVERTGSEDVVQYRGEILPLIHVSRAFRKKRGRNFASGERRRKRSTNREAAIQDGVLQVVVYSGKGRRVGLVVRQILDIVEETIVTRAQPGRPGVLFTAVVQNRVTEFLDVEGLIQSIAPNSPATRTPVKEG